MTFCQFNLMSFLLQFLNFLHEIGIDVIFELIAETDTLSLDENSGAKIFAKVNKISQSAPHMAEYGFFSFWLPERKNLYVAPMLFRNMFDDLNQIGDGDIISIIPMGWLDEDGKFVVADSVG